MQNIHFAVWGIILNSVQFHHEIKAQSSHIKYIPFHNLQQKIIQKSLTSNIKGSERIGKCGNTAGPMCLMFDHCSLIMSN